MDVYGDSIARASGPWTRTVLTAVIIAVSLLTLFPLPLRAQDPVVWTFQGRVFQGEPGDEGRPLADVTVELRAANSRHPDPGELIDGTATDGKGWYGLEVRRSQTSVEVYSIRIIPAPGYEPVDATTVDGEIQASDWIEYVVSLEGKTLAGNKFWLRSTAPHPPQGPDLAAVPVDWRFENDGRSLVIVVEAYNKGGAASPPTLVYVGAPEQSWDGGLAQVRGLEPEDAETVEVWLDIPDELRGRIYTFMVEVDPHGDVEELNEDNNVSWTEGIGIPPDEGPPPTQLPSGQAPDLVCRFVDWWMEEDDRILVLAVEVGNQGDARSPGTQVRVDIPSRGWEAAYAEVEALGPSDAAEVELWLMIPAEGRGTTLVLTVEVDPGNRVAELNDDNNSVRTPAIRIPSPGEIVWPPSVPWGPIIAVVAAVAALVALVSGARRAARRRQSKTRQPVVPPAFPVRLVRIWLTEGPSGTGRSLTDQDQLAAGASYSLHVQVQLRGAQAQSGKAPPTASEERQTQLDVVFFSPESDFSLGERHALLDLPERGTSEEIHHIIIPQGVGHRRLRACIYYGNTLLQSALLEAEVGVSSASGEGAGYDESAAHIARTVDYVASADLTLLERMQQPCLNIFTNQAPDGSHWIGLFASGAAAGFRLRQGDMRVFGAGELETLARYIRGLLEEVEGRRQYRFSGGMPLEDEQISRRERQIVALAIAGRRLYDSLLLSSEDGLDKERMRALDSALREPGIISIARCLGTGPTIPWTALYNLDVDTGRQSEITLCQRFREHLEDNIWDSDTGALAEKCDLLDEPRSCRSSPLCSLSGADAKLTVCPFGFWGFTHQVEQPLQQVNATPVDEVPEELRGPQFSQTSFLMHRRGEKLEIAMGVYPAISGVVEHHREITALRPDSVLEVAYKEDRDGVLELLHRGGYHLYYLYCHGDMEGPIFRLKLGPSRSPGYIYVDNLNPLAISWPVEPRPLVILNGCETLDLIPERINRFLGRMKQLGASGVVGTEIKVWSQLARPFGLRVIDAFLGGSSVGEAFLQARRHLLRQYNPLGLIFSYYSPATLHLHDGDACAWCGAHPPTRLSRRTPSGGTPPESKA